MTMHGMSAAMTVIIMRFRSMLSRTCAAFLVTSAGVYRNVSISS